LDNGKISSADSIRNVSCETVGDFGYVNSRWLKFFRFISALPSIYDEAIMAE
jgi:hypothetical protein